jgi:putative extracellular solute-binding domain protein
VRKLYTCFILVTSIFLSACVSSNSESTSVSAKGESESKKTISIYWWGNQVRNDLTQKVVELYMKENPDIEIKAEFTDWSGYWDKLAASTTGGNMPDIIQMDYSYLTQYADSGQLAALDQYIENGLINTSDVADSVIDSGTINGKCYALSLGSNAPIFIYDKKTVEDSGVTIPKQMTISEMYDIGKTINEKTGIKTYFDGSLNMMQIIARSSGNHLFDELKAGKSPAVEEHFKEIVRFNSAESSIAADLLAEKNADVVETKPIIDLSSWNAFSYSNQYISIQNAAGRELGISMYPKIDNAVTQPMFLKPAMFFSISESSTNKEEAAKFLDWFTNSVDANKILLGERGVPINSKVAESIKSEVDSNVALIFDYINSVSEIATPIDDPDPKGKGEIEALGKSIVEGVRYGDMSADDAAASFISQSSAILKEAN